ncbi:MAG: hypothetical protein KDD45_04025, partial [Bdellovibrionales bacterium]|nr:hypothetical protein [Bdellovibrionales bacterium]
MKKKIFCFILLTFLRTFAQEVLPEKNFITIETAHFYIIFDKNQAEVGQLVANKLEDAYRALNPYFSQKPLKTTVIINDKTDIANGYATRIPYPYIMIYPVLPTSSEGLADYDDWAFELLAHEYTHILTFEGAKGFVKYLRPIFGSVITPNALMPRWWKEGVAVQMETQLSNGGRLRSPYQDAMLRSFVLVDKLKSFEIYEINEFLPSWPEGQRPYLFGSLIWSEMVHEEGSQVIKKLHDRQAGRVPFFINSPAEDLLGADYERFFEDTLYVTEELILKQIDIIKQVPETTNVPLGIKARYTLSPSVSPKGNHLALIAVSSDGERNVQILEKNQDGNFIVKDNTQVENEGVVDDIYNYQENQDSPDAPPGGSIQKVSWFPNGETLLYDKVDSVNSVETFSDLYTYDLRNKETKQLTYGLRAREGSVSQDGKEVVFVKLGAFSTELCTYLMQTNSVHCLWKAPVQERISSPIFLTEDSILFSLRNGSTEEKLWVFNRSNNTLKPLLSKYPFIRFSQIQDNQLYFTSTLNGIRNIYSCPISQIEAQKCNPITHTYT